MKSSPRKSAAFVRGALLALASRPYTVAVCPPLLVPLPVLLPAASILGLSLSGTLLAGAGKLGAACCCRPSHQHVGMSA